MSPATAAYRRMWRRHFRMPGPRGSTWWTSTARSRARASTSRPSNPSVPQQGLRSSWAEVSELSGMHGRLRARRAIRHSRTITAEAPRLPARSWPPSGLWASASMLSRQGCHRGWKKITDKTAVALAGSTNRAALHSWCTRISTATACSRAEHRGHPGDGGAGRYPGRGVGGVSHGRYHRA